MKYTYYMKVTSLEGNKIVIQGSYVKSCKEGFIIFGNEVYKKGW